MLQNIWSQSRLGRSARTRSEGSSESRTNPWLRWRPKRPARPHVLSVAELAECTCPDLCDRDHANE